MQVGELGFLLPLVDGGRWTGEHRRPWTHAGRDGGTWGTPAVLVGALSLELDEADRNATRHVSLSRGEVEILWRIPSLVIKFNANITSGDGFGNQS